MTVGTGMAIAGVWVFAGCCALSRTISGFGVLLAMSIAIGVTIFLA